MKEQSYAPSLLPYLDPGIAGAHLEISLSAEDLLLQTNHPFPFLLVDDSDPFSRLIKAQFTTDSKSKLKDVFLLAQRDDYRLYPNQLVPLANPDIEGFWQKTYEVHCQSPGESPLITLGRQIDKRGTLVQFQPLFFCRTTKNFFHPPCPQCGMFLQQCYNDQLLSSLGMQKYTTSLSRYLFCPSCFSSGKETCFYAHRLNLSDPSLVKSLGDLITGFEQLVRDRNEKSSLPCTACLQNEHCFGAGAAPTTPIVPFSFYPFYMFIYEAMSLNGLDFLALVSGASLDEMKDRIKKSGEVGRTIYYGASEFDYSVHSPFLFKHDARLFLETLFLKLSFLAKVVTKLFPEKGDKQPDPLLYVDRVWVRLTDKAGLLPFLWNFELGFVDLVRGPLEVPSYPELPPSYSLHLLGLVWFSSLLANSKQDISLVYRAVEEALNRVALDSQSASDELVMDSVFLPENIFWNPEPSELAQNWRELWAEALRIGWSLFQASISGKSLWSKERFSQQIEELRARVKKELFVQELSEPTEDHRFADEAIYKILTGILAKWRASRISKPEETLEETVMLAGEDRYEPAFSQDLEGKKDRISDTVMLAPPKTSEDIEPMVNKEFFQETVLLSGKGLHQEMPPADLKVEDAEPELELTETVILTPKEAESPPETIILYASSDQQHRSDTALKNQEQDQTLVPAAEMEIVQETTAKSRKPGDEDDSLSETIILTPRKDRDKK